MAKKSKPAMIASKKASTPDNALTGWAHPVKGVVIILTCFWIFSPAFHGTWIGDDNLYIVQNPLLKDPNRLWKAWFEIGSFTEYYPLQETLQWLEWKSFGNDTLGYHLVNTALHAISSLLVWRLFSKFGLKFAWLGGLLFAVHPLLVETVSLINEFKTALALPPFLGAMCAWIDYQENKRLRFYWLALGLFTIAMLCKIIFAPFPVVILLYAWWKRGKIGWRDVAASAPFLAITLALVAATVVAGERWVHIDFSSTGANALLINGPPRPLLSRLALVGTTLAFYFGRCFWPATPLVVYPQWDVDHFTAIQLLPWLAISAVLSWLWFRRGAWGRHALLGLGYFSLMLAPFLGLNWISYMKYTWAIDHFVYVPIIGLIGLVVAASGQLAGRLPRPARTVAAAVAAGAIVLLACQSRSYAAAFVDEITLCQYTVRNFPGAWMPRHNLALDLLSAGRTTEAIAQFQQTLLYKPDLSGTHLSLGDAYLRLGKTAEALKEFQLEIQLDPAAAEPHNNLGNALLQLNRLPEAMEQYRKAIQLNPDYDAAHYDLAGALVQSGKLAEAITEYQKAAQLNPENPDSLVNLGMSFLQLGKNDEAIAQFRRALTVKADDVDALVNLGLALSQAGRLPEAAAQYQEALKIHPDEAAIYYNLGNCLLQEGQVRAAIDQYQQALKLAPDNAEAHNNLGIALFQLGQKPDAAAQFRQALKLDPDLTSARDNLAHCQNL